MRLLVFCFGLCLCLNVNSWGFHAHKSINYLACFKLPPEMFGFYKANILTIREWAVKADQRRYIVENEGMGHYIDLDHYEKAVPLDTIPKYWFIADSIYTSDSLEQHGILPWRVMHVFYKLRNAFNTYDQQGILRYSADLGHYIADAHVPLHTTANYNGQLSNQHGIHGLWESRLPELFAQDYDCFRGNSYYIDNPLDHIWEIIEESYALKDSVLFLEAALTAQFTEGKYSFENRGNAVIKVYSRDFSLAYHNSMQKMVERRMTAAITRVASFWYTAWIEAGQPDLNAFPQNETGLQMQADSIYSDSIKKVRSKRTVIH